jgi:predicted phosphate transport protein (TIGR00153 family)
MATASLLSRLFPSGRKFYSLFDQASGNLVIMAELFQQYMKEPAKKAEALKRMEELEHANDELTHKLFTELSRNFITPFDREDIHYLATSLDDIADNIWNAAKRMTDYNMMQSNEAMRDFSDINYRLMRELARAVSALSDIKHTTPIATACVRIAQLAQECDTLLDDAAVTLFATSNDASEVVKITDIYALLQVIADKCGEAANAIESVIVKYS